MCGIIGVVNARADAASDLYVGLMSMQHRGKESAGVTVLGSHGLKRIAGAGEVPQVFGSFALEFFHGTIGVGQVRYGTSGAGNTKNIQPIHGVFREKEFALVHNGNLVNVDELRRCLGTVQNVSDTHLIVELISCSERETFEDALIDVAHRLQGSFNLICVFGEGLYVVSDRFGFHPLQFGFRGDDCIIASESCVLDQLGVKYISDVKPGEILYVYKNGYWGRRWTEEYSLKFDIFEYIYFLRPDSVVHGVEAGAARYQMGRKLAETHSVAGDIIVPVSDSGNEAAIGYYERMLELGKVVRFRPWALFRPHTVSRTFIEPVHEMRQRYLNLKFNPRETQLKGQRVVLIDDSLVRGNTQRVVVDMLRRGGALSVFTLIASPIYRYPDFYGIDTYRDRGELIAEKVNGDVDAICKDLGLDYLGYLSLDSVVQAVLSVKQEGSPLTSDTFYCGPFTGEYPSGVMVHTEA